MPLDIQGADLVTVAMLVLLEGLLSADNALVMAVMVMGLPHDAHKRVLRYGLVGAFVLRVLATILATHLIQVVWIKLVGGGYLVYLTVQHFRHRGGGDSAAHPPKAKPLFGLSPFWATVIRVEFINLAFSIDSILVAVAMSPKLWVVMTGGILGIVAMRVVVGKLIALIKRYPALVDGAFVIIAWVGLKLLLEYAHQMHWIAWQVPTVWSLGGIGVIFVASYFYARRQARQPRG
jgi:YkoY family integral membrane protein